MCCGNSGPLKSLARNVASCWLDACSMVIWVGDKNTIFCFHLTKAFGCSLEKSRHSGSDGGQGGAADDCSSDVAASRRWMALATAVWASLTIFHFLASGNLFRDRIFLDVNHRRPIVLLFQFWILTRPVGWRNDTGCQRWSSLFWIGQLVWEEIGSLSKTTKLLLLDSLLQEVCIESGSDGSLALSSLGLSVCLISHNLLYSGLKKAHLKNEN